MTEPEPTGLEWRSGRHIPFAEFHFTADTAGGPGGQHANRSATRISLYWAPDRSTAFSDAEKARLRTAFATRLSHDGTLRVRSSSERSAHRNREECLTILADLVRAALAHRKKRRPTRPTGAAKKRRLDVKRRRSQTKAGRGRPGGDD